MYDDVEEITNALSYMAYGFNGLVVTTGGSGFGQRDFTPEATKRVLDRTAPGMAEAMRQVSPRGRLSRAVAGTRGSALILNLAAAPDRAVEMLDAVLDAVPEALSLLRRWFRAHRRRRAAQPGGLTPRICGAVRSISPRADQIRPGQGRRPRLVHP